MARSLPVVLVSGLLCSPRYWTDALTVLWRFGPVTVADHTRDDNLPAIARRILDAAPPRFALAGHSMGGYIALEIMREAPDRVAKLALLDTTARPDTLEQTERRRTMIRLAAGDRFDDVADLMFPLLVHASRREDGALRQLIRQMADDTGAAAFIRQQTAIIGRPDSRPDLASIDCPTLVLVGDGDELTPPDRSVEMAEAIPGALLEVLPRCGHMVTLESPAATTQALASWMQR